MRIITPLAVWSFLVLAPPHAARSADEVRTVGVWERVAGSPGPEEDVQVPRRSVKVELDKAKLREAARFDAQYGASRKYRGLSVATILATARPSSQVDLAILHFANGMAIPLPFRDKAVMARLDPFVAVGSFPTVEAKGEGADARAVIFHGNKVVVAERWHPALAEKAVGQFSPWEHADSLVGIELVVAASYYRQFDVDQDSRARAGLELFKQSCQFCHGARKIGARFGWDFVEPVPAYTYRKPETRLYYHITLNPWDAGQKGLLMPALRFMTKQEAGLLWDWLKAVATKPMPPYQPVVSLAK